MQIDLSILTSSEASIRKFWQKCFFVLYGLIAFGGLIWSIIFLNSLEGTPHQLGVIIADAIAFIFLPGFIFYHFAYKKAGTFLLTLYLYIKPLNVLIKSVALFTHPFPFPYNVSLWGVLFLTGIIFYILNWKLRKINKKLQLHKIYPEEYILETHTLANATSQSDLDSFYTSLIQKWPQFEKHSTHLYKQQLQASGLGK